MRVSCDVRRPIEFWFTMATWDLMLVVFTPVFALGIYGNVARPRAALTKRRSGRADNQTLQWTGPASSIVVKGKSDGAVPAIERRSVIRLKASLHHKGVPNRLTRIDTRYIL